MLSFKSFLLESLSSVVYHSTNLNGAYHILKDNQFKLSPVIKGDVEHDLNNNRNYYMSFSRSKNSYFVNGLANNNTTPVFTFVVDGDLLNHNYSGKSVNYFNTNDRSQNEYEDRLMTDKPIISNADRYIKTVHCYVPPSYVKFPSAGQTLHTIKTICDTKQIAIYFYTDFKSFILLNRSKSVSLDDNLFDQSQRHVDPVNNDIHKSGQKDYESIVSILQKNGQNLDRTDQQTLAYISTPRYKAEIADNILKYLKSLKNTNQDVISQYNEIMKNSKSKDIEDLLTKIGRVYGQNH